MGVEGKYQFVKEEGWGAHFKALLGDRIPEGASKSPPPIDSPLEIAISGENVTIKSGEHSKNYVLNKPVEEKFGNRTFQIVAKLEDDNTLVLERTSENSVNKSTYALSGSDLVLTHAAIGRSDVPEGKKYYKKL